MIDLFASSLVIVEDADRSVKAASNELSAGWCIIDIGDGRYVILVDNLCFVHLAHIEAVTVGVIRPNSEVNRLDGVPADATALVSHVDLLDWSLASNIVERYRSIHASSTKDIHGGGVVSNLCHTFTAPRQFQNRLAPIVGPNLNELPSRSELWSLPVMIDHSDHKFAHEFDSCLELFALIEGLFEVVEVDDLVCSR